MKTPARRHFSSTYPQLDGHVIVVDGYGITIRVERGHLQICDGHGRDRRERRIPRIGHNVRRLIVVGHTGTISLEALRWLDQTGIHFTQLDTNGHLLAASANPGNDDARLRRAQHLAGHEPTRTDVTRYLIAAKVEGQRSVAADHLAVHVADGLDRHLEQLDRADSVDEILKVEAHAALDYFAAWKDRVSITWASKSANRVPDHWHTFTSRRSLITRTGSNRATNPVNALLNYLYGLAEIECRHACLTVGLDPGLGFFHIDVESRDSLALDLLETIRPDVDRYVFELLAEHVFAASDFTEQPDGCTRINPPLTHRLAATLLDWQIAIAPHVDHITRLIVSSTDRPVRTRRLAERAPASPANRVRRHHGLPCRDCGTQLGGSAMLYCPDCLPQRRRAQRRRGVAASAASLTSEARRQERGRRVSTGKQAAVERARKEFGYTIADWDDHKDAIRALTLKQIMSATGLAITASSRIKSGKQIPHPRLWQTLFDAAHRVESTCEETSA